MITYAQTDELEPAARSFAPLHRLRGRASANVLEWNYRAHLSDNAPHRHTYSEVCLVGEQGAGEFHVAGHIHRIGPGDIFFARPGIVHQIVNTQTPNMELFWVGFSVEAGPTGEVAALHSTFRDSDVAVTQDAAVWHLWRALRGVMERDGMEWDRERQSVAAALLLSLMRAGQNTFVSSVEALHHGPDRYRQAGAAVRYVEDNLNRRLPLAEIAMHLYVSPRQLTRLFRDATGLSPATYIERARLDRAVRLLLKTDKPLKEIASEVGFDDASHFSRVFRRGKGVPPARFRRNVQQDAEDPCAHSGPNLLKTGGFI